MFIFSAETWRPFTQRAGWHLRSCWDTLSISVLVKHPAESLTAACFTWIYEVSFYNRVISLIWQRVSPEEEMKPVRLCRVLHTEQRAAEKLHIKVLWLMSEWKERGVSRGIDSWKITQNKSFSYFSWFRVIWKRKNKEERWGGRKYEGKEVKECRTEELKEGKNQMTRWRKDKKGREEGWRKGEKGKNEGQSGSGI